MEMSIRFPGPGLVFDYVPRSFQIFGMEFTIYGVLIAVGALLGMGIVTFWQSADIACPGILLGQAIGRWGNFFNRESFGEYTNLPWAMQIPVSAVRSGEVSGAMRDNLLTINGISYIQVQPVFLYESLWCLLLFLLLMAMRRKKKYEGELFMIYLAGYGLGRFFFEWIRTDKLYIPGTKVGISLVISAALFVIFMPTVIVRRVMVQKRAVIRRQRRKRFLDEAEKESRNKKDNLDMEAVMKTEEEARTEDGKQVESDEKQENMKKAEQNVNWENSEYTHIPEQWKQDVGNSPTNSKEEL